VEYSYGIDPKKYFEMFPLNTVKLPEIIEDDLDDLPEAALQLILRSLRFSPGIWPSVGKTGVSSAMGMVVRSSMIWKAIPTSGRI